MASASPRHRLYIDESGDHTYQLVNDPRHRYLCLMGVWFAIEPDYNEFADAIRRLKDETFGPRHDDPVCLHRRDIIERRGPFARLRAPQIRDRFDSGLLNVIADANFVICAVVIDKLEHQSKTYRDLYHPYHYCLAALLERYAGWLRHRNVTGDVLAESRGRREDRDLRKEFVRTMEDGTRFVPSEVFQTHLTSKKLKLKRKEHNIAGLQLADLLAAPIKRQLVEGSCGQGFSAALLGAVEGKFNCNANDGRVEGYGLKLLR